MLRAVAGGVELQVQVQPRASRTELAGTIGGAIKIRLAAPPVDGEANEELIRFLAKTLGVAKRSVTIDCSLQNRLMPGAPWRRPLPLSFTPPNGTSVTATPVITSLTQTHPASTSAARASPFALSAVQTLAFNP